MKRLDDGVGLLMEELRNRGLLENTLVIFLGNHGPPFPRAKVSAYEAGLKVPFIMAWPGRIAPASTAPEFVSTIDIFPTLAEAIGWDGTLPGEGLSLLRLGSDAPGSWRQSLFGEYNAHQSSAFHPQRTIRNGQYKLILTLLRDRTHRGDNRPPERLGEYLGKPAEDLLQDSVFGNYFRPPQVQLFDLEADPLETQPTWPGSLVRFHRGQLAGSAPPMEGTDRGSLSRSGVAGGCSPGS